MTAYLLEYLSQMLRWLHVVAAIAWIGESFYFVALDRGLKRPGHPSQGLAGESWSVHGGGFYLKQKFLPAPPQLPEELHWSKWKSYTTWLSGAALFTLVYLSSPAIWLVDPDVAALSPRAAVWLAIAFPVLGWLVYDALCLALAGRDRLLGIVVAFGVPLLCWGTTQWFSGRAAFLLAGATLATIMSANVFFVIIPGQKRMVAALQRGEAPNPDDGARGKQRSVHNTYFTLPVVFAMLSIHFGAAFSHPHNWVILAAFMAAGALVRQFFVLWHSGARAWWLLAAGGALLVALAFALAPRPRGVSPVAAGTMAAEAGSAPVAPDEPVATEVVMHLARKHCVACHSAQPSLMTMAPKGAAFDTPEQLEAQAALVAHQVAVLRIMPPGNLTGLQENERELFARWAKER